MGTKKTIYRNSDTGRIISKETAARLPANTVEKERVSTGKK